MSNLTRKIFHALLRRRVPVDETISPTLRDNYGVLWITNLVRICHDNGVVFIACDVNNLLSEPREFLSPINVEEVADFACLKYEEVLKRNGTLT